jgi:hypothetical protein
VPQFETVMAVMGCVFSFQNNSDNNKRKYSAHRGCEKYVQNFVPKSSSDKIILGDVWIGGRIK